MQIPLVIVNDDGCLHMFHPAALQMVCFEREPGHFPFTNRE
jgi:hypothetical protein